MPLAYAFQFGIDAVFVLSLAFVSLGETYPHCYVKNKLPSILFHLLVDTQESRIREIEREDLVCAQNV